MSKHEYKCPICWGYYDTEALRDRCERGHHKVTRISAASYAPHDLSRNMYPSRITVEFDDGTHHYYIKA